MSRYVKSIKISYISVDIMLVANRKVRTPVRTLDPQIINYQNHLLSLGRS